MQMIMQKSKVQTFIPWILDHMRSSRSNLWRQLGMWAVMLMVVSFMAPMLP